MLHSRLRLSAVTLIELLVVVAVIGLLIVAMSISIRSYMLRSEDAQRKSDIKKISQALEQYYNDYNGYPSSLETASGQPTCGTSTKLVSYLKDVPCDPTGGSQRPYLYIPQGTSRTGNHSTTVYPGYRLLASLTYTADEQIDEVGCPSALGCGGLKLDGSNVPIFYNFGVAANAKVNMNP